MSDLCVGPGTTVTLHFSLALDDGSLVDSNFDAAPATFIVGDGSLLPGFEAALFGLQAGAEAEFTIPPEEGFGQTNSNNLQEIPRDQFTDMDLEKGMVVSFADAQKAELPGVVSEFDDTTVIVDFNHPLAGKTITFAVRIVLVEPEQVH